MRKSRYTLWGPCSDGYGWRRWGVNDRLMYEGQIANISGRGYDTRREAVEELRRLRREERKSK